MLVCSCDKCGRKYQIPEHLAGKKVKCPGCGVAPAPAGQTAAKSAPQVTARGEDDAVEAAPGSPMEQEATMAPAQSADNTDSHEEQAAAELYDFLAPPQSPDELGRLGAYRVLKVLGQGGMGVVFQAEDPQAEKAGGSEGDAAGAGGQPDVEAAFHP